MNRDMKKMKPVWMKKAILVLILMCMGYFAYTQKPLFYIEKTYSVGSWEDNGQEQEEQEISLLGNQVIEQEFIALQPELTNVQIDFKAWEQKNGNGSIRVEIRDLEGNVLASAEKKVTGLIPSKSGITTTFSVLRP